MINWNIYYDKIDERKDYSDMTNKAFQISNYLVKADGFPDDWNSSDVKIIGLADSDRVLSSDKINLLIDTPLNKTTDIFKTYKYNFSIIIVDIDGIVLHNYGYSKNNPKKSVSIRRYVNYNNEESILELNLWNEK